MYKLNNISSIFFCEAYAIMKALEKINTDCNQLKFILCTDSRTVIEGISNPDPPEPIIQIIKKCYTSVTKFGKKVILK